MRTLQKPPAKKVPVHLHIDFRHFDIKNNNFSIWHISKLDSYTNKFKQEYTKPEFPVTMI